MASASGSAGKTCRRCGVDCSKLPRVKDDRGRYYCKPCYEAARREKLRRNAARAAAAGQANPAADEDEPIDVQPIDMADEGPPTVEFALDADSFVIGDLSDAELPAVTSSGGACPGCGGALPAATVVCVACGFNRKTGRRMEMSIAAAGTAPPTQRGKASQSKAPVATGVTAQPWFFGVAATGFFVCLYFFATQNIAVASVYQGLQMLFALVIALWIVVAAFHEGAVHGILCLLCGPYTLYYGFIRQENRHLKFGMGASLVATVLSFVLGGNMLLETLSQRAGT